MNDMLMAPISSENYLTLALLSGGIIDELRDLVEHGRRSGHLRKVLPEAIGCLQAATDGQRAHLTEHGLKMVQNYDQLRTITQVFPNERVRGNMIKTLKSLQSSNLSLSRQKIAAMEAIKFFDAIENRALRGYRDTSQGE